jgi:Kdo2-lipid IVA lauroyltransferase/acyltransferase
MYQVVYGLLWLLSLLPIRILYFFSDFFYGLLFYVFHYRRDIVLKNLALAFPEKTEKERWKIAKQFYHNLVDTFMETIKMISASPEYLSKRVAGNWEIINRLEATGKNIQIHLGHNFNWEWANAVGVRNFKIPFVAVYMPLASTVFDRLFRTLRSRYGTQLVRATHMQRDFLKYRDKQYILGLVADQNTGHPHAGWWFRFFGHPAPFVKGPARAAILGDTEVVFAFIHKVKRGFYKVVISEPIRDVTSLTEIELTRRYVRYLEDVIRKYPEMWLWSHRRWKHEWKEEYGPVQE